MSNTITTGANGISIVFDGSTAWDSDATYIGGLCISSIEMKPTATNDVAAVREGGGSSGRKIFDAKAADAFDNRVKYFNTEGSYRKYKLYVVGAEVTNGVELIIEFK